MRLCKKVDKERSQETTLSVPAYESTDTLGVFSDCATTKHFLTPPRSINRATLYEHKHLTAPHGHKHIKTPCPFSQIF